MEIRKGEAATKAGLRLFMFFSECVRLSGLSIAYTYSAMQQYTIFALNTLGGSEE